MRNLRWHTGTLTVKYFAHRKIVMVMAQDVGLNLLFIAVSNLGVILHIWNGFFRPQGQNHVELSQDTRCV